MNLKGRYQMVRQAALQLVGLPTDSIDDLKQMASHIRVAAMVDADAAVSLLVLQTLIATHDQATASELTERYTACADHVAKEIISEVDEFSALRAKPESWRDDAELVALVDAILTGVPNDKRR